VDQRWVASWHGATPSVTPGAGPAAAHAHPSRLPEGTSLPAPVCTSCDTAAHVPTRPP